MSAQPLQGETVLVVGSTGNIGVSAIKGALASGRNVLAIVRNQNSAKKLSEHVGEGQERITIVEADVTSDQGVQSVVDQVRAGSLPAFQHVYSTAGGEYTDQSMLKTSTEELRYHMMVNFESNFFAYRATVPYLIEQKDKDCTWTICTGAQGDLGLRPLPAMSQGALFSMSTAACRELANTNVRFNEVYLYYRVEYDSVAVERGNMKASFFARTYEKILANPEIKSCRVRVAGYDDVENLKYASKI